jgi:hypothetical protein
MSTDAMLAIVQQTATQIPLIRQQLVAQIFEKLL